MSTAGLLKEKRRKTDTSAVASPSLFVDTSELDGIMVFVGAVLFYVPLYLYIGYDRMKKRQ